MKSKHKFTPDQVVPMEERALLSGFPTALHPVTKLNFRGAFVLTSNTYNKLQSQINTVTLNFEKSVVKAFDRFAGFTAAFDSYIGDSFSATPYAPGTLLAIYDAKLAPLEFKVPWGGNSPGSPTGGLGLTNRTNLTTTNPAEPASPSGANPVTGGSTDSPAELMDETIILEEASTSPSLTALVTSMNAARKEILGIVPGYVRAFGPPGLRYFGTANSN
jgi:hypothetical protein